MRDDNIWGGAGQIQTDPDLSRVRKKAPKALIFNVDPDNPDQSGLRMHTMGPLRRHPSEILREWQSRWQQEAARQTEPGRRAEGEGLDDGQIMAGVEASASAPKSAVSVAVDEVIEPRWRGTVAEPRADQAGYLMAGLQRPPAWLDTSNMPLPGAWCGCCGRQEGKGGRWWREREAPTGWCCWTCHPPVHLGPQDVVEHRT